jgi:hypothetical protein
MLDIYLLIALVFYMINAYGYHEIIKDNIDDMPLRTTIMASLIYFFISLIWPVQLFYIAKLLYDGAKKNGEGN